MSAIPNDLVPTTLKPDLDRIKSLVLDSVTSPHSRRAYDKSLREFLIWYSVHGKGYGFTKATVQLYARHLEEQSLSASTINVRLTAVRRLAAEAADNALLAPELASGISRVKGIKQQGTRTGNWLTVEQAERLIDTPDAATLKGKRDRALLAVLIGCGLRRSEASELRFEHVQQRDGRWVIVDLRRQGKPYANGANALMDEGGY